MKIQTWQVIDALELEKLIKETYGRSFSVIAHLEASNDSVHYFDVPADEGFYFSGDTFLSLDEWQALPPQRNPWDDAGPHPKYEDIINDLHNRGLLPEGSFKLHVSW